MLNIIQVKKKKGCVKEKNKLFSFHHQNEKSQMPKKLKLRQCSLGTALGGIYWFFSR
jgi:hypothetical protein